MGVIEEASRVTDPTPQWPSRIKVGLIKCEEAEKGGRVREIQVLAHIFPYRKKKEGRRLPAQKGWNYPFKFSTLCVRETDGPLSYCLAVETLSKWSSVISVLSSPFCISSSAGQIQVLNCKFYLLGS